MVSAKAFRCRIGAFWGAAFERFQVPVSSVTGAGLLRFAHRPPCSTRAIVNPIARGGPFWTPITPQTGSFFQTESHQIVDKRFDKRQSMRWTPTGAHLLLQTRTRVLNGDLDRLIRGRRPNFRKPAENGFAPVCDGLHLAGAVSDDVAARVGRKTELRS